MSDTPSLPLPKTRSRYLTHVMASLLFVLLAVVWFALLPRMLGMGSYTSAISLPNNAIPFSTWPWRASEGQVMVDDDVITLTTSAGGVAYADVAGETLKSFHPDTHIWLSGHVEQLDDDMRLGLWWKGDKNSGQLVLPKVGEGDDFTVDLSQQAAWQGSLDVMSLMAMPESLLPDHATPRRQVVVRDVKLYTDAVAQQRESLWDKWFATRMWQGKSINTQGFEVDTRGDTSQMWMALGLCVAGWLVVLLFYRTRGWQMLLLPVAIVWVALAVVEWRQQWLRAEVITAQSSLADKRSDIQLSAMPRMPQIAAWVRQMHASRGSTERLVVYGHSAFEQYLAYLLRPLDVGNPRYPPDLRVIPDAAFLLVTTDKQWPKLQEEYAESSFQGRIITPIDSPQGVTALAVSAKGVAP